MIWLIILFFTVILKLYCYNFISYYVTRNANTIVTAMVPILVTMLVGISIGISSFIKEKNEKGKWKINFCRLVIVGIPSFLIAFIPMWAYLGMWPPAFPILLIQELSTTFQIILGYICISIFYKCE